MWLWEKNETTNNIKYKAPRQKENVEKNKKEFTSTEELIAWFSEGDFLESKFAKTIKLYKAIDKIPIPYSSNDKCDYVFIVQESNYVNFVFDDPSVRVCIEPLSSDDNKDYDTSSIADFMKSKYNIKLNSIENLDDETLIEHGYTTHCYEEKVINVSGKEIKSLVETMFNLYGNSEYIVSFLLDEFLVKIICFDSDENTFNFDSLNKLEFNNEALS